MAAKAKIQNGNGSVDGEGTEGRRRFVIHLAVAAAGIAAIAPAGVSAASAATTHEMEVLLPIAELPWRRRIFCQFDGADGHKELLESIVECAREIGCEIVKGVDGDPDIFAYGCFVQILDRNSVGEEMWRDYAAAYKDAGDITPCFIIDDRTDLPLPSWKFAKQIDMRDPSAVTAIVATIRQMKAEMNRRLPAFFVRNEG